MPGGFWYYAHEDPHALALVDTDGTEWRCGRPARPLQPDGATASGRSACVRVTPSPRSCRTGWSRPTLYLAALQIGLYYVPINYRLSPPEIAYILSDSDAEGVRDPRTVRVDRRAGRRRGGDPR